MTEKNVSRGNGCNYHVIDRYVIIDINQEKMYTYPGISTFVVHIIMCVYVI